MLIILHKIYHMLFFWRASRLLLENKTYSACVSRIANKIFKRQISKCRVKSLILFPIFVKTNFMDFRFLMILTKRTPERRWSKYFLQRLETYLQQSSKSTLKLLSMKVKKNLGCVAISQVGLPSRKWRNLYKIYLNLIVKVAFTTKIYSYPNQLLFTDLIHPNDAFDTMSEIKAICYCAKPRLSSRFLESPKRPKKLFGSGICRSLLKMIK
jgi:hypothetical protein